MYTPSHYKRLRIEGLGEENNNEALNTKNRYGKKTFRSKTEKSKDQQMDGT